MKQVPTRGVTTAKIMASRAFQRDLTDVRAGIGFDWRVGGDDVNDAWRYERGRAFGFVAPLNMPLHIGRELNPKAVALCEAAFNRRLIV